jgi:hypothetical protein
MNALEQDGRGDYNERVFLNVQPTFFFDFCIFKVSTWEEKIKPVFML